MKFLAALMAVFFPVSVWCADMQGAILNVSNSALVNGTGVSRSTAIFIGDKLQVPANGHAFLSFAGASVVIAPGSALTFQGKALSLEPDSGLGVSTNTGLSIKAGKVTISPAHQEGKFQVARAGGTILVAAKLGSVSIFDGSSTTTVAEGSSAFVDELSPQQGGATAGASTGIPAPGRRKAAAILILLGVAAAAILIALETSGAPPVSPARP